MQRHTDGGGGWYPAAKLVAPVSEEAVPQFFQSYDRYAEWTSYITLSHWAFKAWELFAGDDIKDQWSDLLAGDWREVAEMANACRHLCEFTDEMREALTSLQHGGSYNWSGEAASATSAWFVSLDVALGNLSTNLGEMVEGLNQAAFGVYNCSETVKEGINIVVGLAIGIGVSLAAAAASSWTGIGGLLGGGAAAIQVLAAIDRVTEIVDAINKSFSVAKAAMSVIAPVAAWGDFDSVALPGAYDNRQVS